jgi:hypothetical protein
MTLLQLNVTILVHVFFPLHWRVGGVEFLLFLMCSHQVLNGFSTCSTSSQFVPQHVPNSSLLLYRILCPKFYFVTYIRSPKEEITTMELFLELSKGLIFIFAMAQPMKPITKKKNLINYLFLGGFPQN